VAEGRREDLLPGRGRSARSGRGRSQNGSGGSGEAKREDDGEMGEMVRDQLLWSREGNQMRPGALVKRGKSNEARGLCGELGKKWLWEQKYRSSRSGQGVLVLSFARRRRL
jgi:hypothetical protein